MDDKLKIEIRELAKLETTGYATPTNPHYIEWLETGCVTLPRGDQFCFQIFNPNYKFGFR